MEHKGTIRIETDRLVPESVKLSYFFTGTA